jgi:hypothetical protein
MIVYSAEIPTSPSISYSIHLHELGDYDSIEYRIGYDQGGEKDKK